ncbi:MAG TPA: hypothetical protein VJ995_00295 [Geothermobacteraceae bacterium]|nr:hypothetical protein [Geothermobacteraceae bacterium]
MSQHYEKPIEVTNILLDPENPRHNVIKAQRDIIQVMSNDIKVAKKLVKLAEDIVLHGNNPSDIPIVMPHEEEGKFIVLEGNRRIAALKLLETPSQLPGGSNRFVKKKFVGLGREFSKNPIHSLKCIVFPDRDSADHWITLKHTGENEGAGTVDWGGTERNRHRTRQQKPSPELTLKTFLYENCDLSAEEKAIISKIPITNIQRAIGDPDLRRALGLKVKGDQIWTDLAREEAARVLVEFFMPFATGEKNVGDLYSKKDRLAYLNGLPSESLPNSESKHNAPWYLDSPPDKNETSTTSDNERKKRKRSRPDSTKRHILIPRDCILTINSKRINKVYIELRSLNVDDYTNAVSVLFRVFWELSLDDFVEKKRLPNIDSNTSLPKKMEAVATYFKTNKILGEDQLKPARKAVSDKHSILSVDTFHAYVHSRHLNPTPLELKLAWDNIQPFMEKLWE